MRRRRSRLPTCSQLRPTRSISTIPSVVQQQQRRRWPRRTRRHLCRRSRGLRPRSQLRPEPWLHRPRRGGLHIPGGLLQLRKDSGKLGQGSGIHTRTSQDGGNITNNTNDSFVANVWRTIMAISCFGVGLQGGAQRPVHQIAVGKVKIEALFDTGA
jgi:hypothetical protein